MANRFNNNTVSGIGTSVTEVYATGASKKATVIGINLANKLITTITASIFFENAAAQQVYIVKDVVIPAGNSLAAIGGDQKLVLVENNRMLVSSSDADAVDVIVSVLEIT
jgi:hypothetical protein